MAPVIRLTPTGGPQVWHSPASMVGPLLLNLEILVQGYDAADLMNLWKAVGAAFYAPTATTFAAIQSTLRAAARTLRARNSRRPRSTPSPNPTFCFR